MKPITAIVRWSPGNPSVIRAFGSYHYNKSEQNGHGMILTFGSFHDRNRCVKEMNGKIIKGDKISVEAPHSNYAVCLIQAPSQAVEKDIKDVFSKLDVIDIRKKGVQWIIEFDSKDGCDSALKMSPTICGSVVSMAPYVPITDPVTPKPIHINPKFAVYLCGLPSGTTEGAIRKGFNDRSIAKIALRVPTATVYFKYERAWKDALTPKRSIIGKEVIIRPNNFQASSPYSLYIANIPPGTTESLLKTKIFSDLKIKAIKFTPQRFFVTFTTEASCGIALKRACIVNGVKVSVEKTRHSHNTVCLNGIPPDTKKEDIEKAFDELSVENVEIKPQFCTIDLFDLESFNHALCPELKLYKGCYIKIQHKPQGRIGTDGQLFTGTTDLSDEMFGVPPTFVDFNAALEKAKFPKYEVMINVCNNRVEECGSRPPLSIEELKAIYIYTYEADNRDDSPYIYINQGLAKRNNERLHNIRGYFMYLFKALRALPRYPQCKCLYRGIDGSNVDLEKYKEDKEGIWTGFTSTSTSEEQASKFIECSEKPIMFIIRGSFIGYSIKGYSINPQEEGNLFFFFFYTPCCWVVRVCIFIIYLFIFVCVNFRGLT